MKEMVGGCCVCSDDRGWTENPLVYCDGQACTVAVHQACYGIVTVPTGNWYCRRCESQERTARLRCELCPSKDGALKRTDNNGWAHVVCALYIPEVRFGNVSSMEPIILQQIPPERFNKVCYICEESGKGTRSTIGACMQCNKSGCKQQFHVTCAQALGLLCEEAGNYLDNVKYCGYCQHHYSKLKKSGNVKPIPPYRPVTADTSDSSSPEKEPGDNWGKATAKRKLSATGKLTAPGAAGLKTPVNVSPGSNSTAIPSNPLDDVGGVQSTSVGLSGVMQIKDSIPVLSQINTGKNDNSAGGKFTTSNFVEGVVTPSESVFGEVAKSSSKKRKKDDVPVSNVVNPDDSSKKFKTDNMLQQMDSVQPASVVVKLPMGANTGTAGNNSPVLGVPVPSRIISTSSLSPSTTSSIVVSVPLATVSALATTVAPTITAFTTTQPLTAVTVTSTVAPSNSVLTNSNINEESPAKRGRSQSTEKADKSGRNKKRGGGNVSTNVGSKRGGRSNQSTPPPPPPPAQPVSAASVTVSVSSVTTSVVTATTLNSTTAISTNNVTQPPTAATPASVVAHSSNAVKVESPPSSPDGGKRSNHKARKHQNLKDDKEVKPDVKLFQNGINAPHMLGNQLNPASTMAQKMSDTLNQELEAHSIFTNDSAHSNNNLIGPQLHSRVIASVRSSTAVTTTSTTSSGNNSVTAASSSGVGWGGGPGTVPQTLDQLLERQWEQGSQFLMEQAQHFDSMLASLLSCLHQLRAENLRLEEHVSSLLQRRDHLLAVNARLAIPLTQVNNVHPVTAGNMPSVSQPGQAIQDGNRGASQRLNNSYPSTHPMENGLPPSPPATAYRASPAQPSPSNISRHHSPGNANVYVSSTPGVVVPRSSVTSEPHRSDSRRSNPQSTGPPPSLPQSASYPAALYQVPSQQQQMVMRREVVADLHNQIPPASKPS